MCVKNSNLKVESDWKAVEMQPLNDLMSQLDVF